MPAEGPRSHRHRKVYRSTEEVRSTWSTAEAKLRAAGATDDEVEAFRQAWPALDQSAMLAASGETLRMVLADMRAGGELVEPELPGVEVFVNGAPVEGVVEATVGPDETVAQRPYGEAEQAYAAEGVAGWTVPHTVHWIDEPGYSAVARAAVVLAAEEASESPRKGVLEHARAVLGDAQSAE